MKPGESALVGSPPYPVDDPFGWFEPFPVPGTPHADPGVAIAPDAVRQMLLEARVDACGLQPTRTASTIESYIGSVRTLFRQAGASTDLEADERLTVTIGWFGDQHGSWRKSVVRHHRAALLWAVGSLVEAGLADRGDLRRWLSDLQRKPNPCSPQAPPRTSARKRMTFTRDEYEELIQHLVRRRSETSWLLAGLIGYGQHFGLRPAEFWHAFVRRHQLVVRCAKATNGRALGTERAYDLHGFDPQLRRGLVMFLRRLRRAAAAASSRPAFQDRLAKALTRACHACGIKPISLYTLRHQAIANAKLFLDRIEVAAFAGHASPRTASRNYARRKSGWGVPLLCRPADDSVGAIRDRSCRGRVGAGPSEDTAPLASGDQSEDDDLTPIGLRRG
ncbi:Phage integrase family protein [Methylobacterium sp. GXF4]|nr:Phage integrase family protein [Methylobacterium sp. GXF4]